MSDAPLILVSADCHAGPPVADFGPYVDPDHREEFGRFLAARAEWRAEQNRSMGLKEDGELVHALFGEDMVDSYEGQEAVTLGGCTGVFDSDRRTAELEQEGIVAEVIFPDFQNSNEPPWGAAFPFPGATPELRLAGARAYNRWLADFCSLLPGRRAGLAIIQPYDLDDAVADVRWAREAGLSGVMLPTGDAELPPYHDPRYGPLWAACADQDLTLTVHSGGTPWEGYGGAAMWSSKIEFLWWCRRPLWQIIFGGVFEDYPSLRLAFTEQGADWIPSTLSRLDEQYRSPFERGIRERLSKSPSEYWASNCYVGASFMSRGECDIRDQIGVGRIMWGSDYPHIEGTWPHSIETLRDAVVGCTEAEVRAMVGQTAAAVYGFDLDRLAEVADRIGPPVDQVVSPFSPPAVVYDPVDYAMGRVSTKETARRILAAMAPPRN